MAVFYSSATPRSVDELAVKRPRTTGPSVHFKAMQLSWTSLALVGIDNHGKVRARPGSPCGGWGSLLPPSQPPPVGLWQRSLSQPQPQLPPSPQLSLLRVSPSMGHPLDVSLALRHLLFLLEYCMVTGYDWWDILLHVQPSMVPSLVEKLHEEYTRQSAALQQVHHGGGTGGWGTPAQALPTWPEQPDSGHSCMCL